MNVTRHRILPGVFLTCVRTDQFKTGLLSVNLLTRLRRETAARNTLLPSVLRRGAVGYPDMSALAEKLDNLYGARLSSISRKFGEIHAFGFWADFIDERYLPGGEPLLEETAALLGEVLLHPITRGGLLLRDYVESEREKLLEDIRARVNDKGAYSRQRLVELMCAAEDYAVDVLGTENTAADITCRGLSKHYRAVLASAPIEILYCGAAEPARVEDALRAALEVLPRGDLDTDIGTDIRMNTVEEGPRQFSEIMDVTQARLGLGYRLGESMEEPDHAVLRVMNAVFGAGVSSKLFRNVRERMSLCYSVGSAADLIKGVLLVSAGIEPSQRDRTQEAIIRELEAVQNGDITPEELSAAKAALSCDLRGFHDSPARLEGFWLGQNLLGLEYGPDELAAMVEAVTAEDVIAAARALQCDMIYFMRGPEDGGGEESANDAED